LHAHGRPIEQGNVFGKLKAPGKLGDNIGPDTLVKHEDIAYAKHSDALVAEASLANTSKVTKVSIATSGAISEHIFVLEASISSVSASKASTTGTCIFAAGIASSMSVVGFKFHGANNTAGRHHGGLRIQNSEPEWPTLKPG